MDPVRGNHHGATQDRPLLPKKGGYWDKGWHEIVDSGAS